MERENLRNANWDKMISEIYFWQPELNPHTIPLANAFARHGYAARTVFIAQNPLSETRVSQGVPGDWMPDCELVVTPSQEDVAQMIARSATDSVHVFSGMHWVPCIIEGIKQAAQHKRMFGVMSEPRVLTGWKGKMRLLHSWTREQRHRKHASFVAAIGRHGPMWFRLTGYGARVFPFAYFIDPPAIAAPPAPRHDGGRLRIGYSGRLIESKGFGVFLRLIEAAQGRHDFSIIGSGAMAEAAQAAAAHHPNVTYAGVIPMAQVPTWMAGLDALVVPSLTTDDGWAVVVSEALFAGTFAVINGRVGASVLADGAQIAQRIDSDDPKAYLTALETAAARGALAPGARATRQSYAQTHLTADVGAAYLMGILDHLRGGATPRPKPYYL
ncbi:hypothetical protein CKO11_11185 [Rhodobacter sp. TJ_12]|uniref:glycosyltransferase n=1 Tax=Rhodobacter sp. TJ_12 TaxID=2029399 RepID=UPI001CC1607E|nr:glycosyltransferase [Rhodobacter sp. TJ_12]MBZ4023023.1 hypothetical protein [Rhodobacter sp. TJ_12]